MFAPLSAFSGLTVDDLAAAKQFYGTTLGLSCTEEVGGMRVDLPGDALLWIYAKGDHIAPSHTVLDFVVEDIDQAVDQLTQVGVAFERYPDGPPQDDKGVLRGRSHRMGPDIAWFKDPAGNILAVLQR